jgi:hypothetical protein
MTIYCADYRGLISVSQHQGRPYVSESCITGVTPEELRHYYADGGTVHYCLSVRLVWETACG